MSERNLLHLLFPDDSDKEIKLDKEKFECYSKKKMKDLYPKKRLYQVIGETKKHNRKEEIGYLTLGKKEFIVSDEGENSHILNYVAGYIKVGENTYVELLKSRIPFLLLFWGLLLGILAGLLILLLTPKEPQPIVINPLPPKDVGQTEITDDPHPAAPTVSEEGGGSVSMIYTLSAKYDTQTGDIGIYFRNPSDSNHDVVVELYAVSGETKAKIATSGRVEAGYGISNLKFDAPMVQLAPGSYAAEYRLLFYNPATGEKALVESVISDVVLSVQ